MIIYLKESLMKFIFTFFLLATFSPTSFSKGKLTVIFNHKGKKYSIGSSINNGTYIFNKGAKKVIKIATLDWKPYIGKSLCKQGWVQQYTIAILTTLGYEIHSDFFPWARSVSRVEKGKYDILYPEYFIDKSAPSDVYKGTRRLKHLSLSKPFPGGPIAFMAKKGFEPNYNKNTKKTFFNLKNEKIGVVRGYQNTPEFDKLMDKNPPFFNITTVNNDIQNAKILFKGRVNLIIGDPSVIKYSIKTTNKLSNSKKNKILNKIKTVQPHIKYNNLFYALSKKKKNWENLRKAINSKIQEFETEGTMYKIIEKTNKFCGFYMEDTLKPYNP